MSNQPLLLVQLCDIALHDAVTTVEKACRVETHMICILCLGFSVKQISFFDTCVLQVLLDDCSRLIFNK